MSVLTSNLDGLLKKLNELDEENETIEMVESIRSDISQLYAFDTEFSETHRKAKECNWANESLGERVLDLYVQIKQQRQQLLTSISRFNLKRAKPPQLTPPWQLRLNIEELETILKERKPLPAANPPIDQKMAKSFDNKQYYGRWMGVLVALVAICLGFVYIS